MTKPGREPFLHWVIAACIGLFCCLAAAHAAERRVALVIGNGDYTHVPRLDNATRDAHLIASTLMELGFTVIGGDAQENLDKPALERVIREFGRSIGPGTIALFYYSGHGLQIRGGNYLVPVSANLANASDVDFELVDVDVITRQMDAAHSSLNLLILDACRNNPFGGRGLRDGSGGLAEMRAPPATLISYATQPGGVAQDGVPGGDSPYTLALASSLGTRGIDVLKAFNLVGVKVSRATAGAQTPWVAASPIEGEFVLAPNIAEPPVAATVPAPAPQGFAQADREALYWQSVQTSNRPDELEAYIRRYPDGTFADLARLRLALLQPPRSAVPTAPPDAPPQDPQAQPSAIAPPQQPRTRTEPVVLRPRSPPQQTPRTKPAIAPPPPRPVNQVPAATVVGFSATAVDARGRRFQSNRADSEGSAITEALRQCHGGPDGSNCRIVGMAHSGP